MESRLEKGTLTLWPEGRIDSVNAAAVEEEIRRIRAEQNADAMILDCERLEYLSSAGLRILLRIKKTVPDFSLVNVSPELYEILEMTGFTELMEVRKAYRVISVEGCEIIGRGANGTVYRIDRDTVVKAYRSADALAEIHRERELARTAFVLGIPTAIPYDVVRIAGGGYGSVFELLNATSFAKLLIRGEKTVDEVVEMSIALLKTIHATEVNPASVPSMKQTALDWADFLRDHLPADQDRKLHALIEAVPEDNHLLHGDYHVKNITRQGDENLVLDMDTLCHGHPIFELASMYNAYVGYSETDPTVTPSFYGFDASLAREIWAKSLRRYLDGADEETVRAVEEKAMIVGCARMLRRRIRRNGYETEEGRREIARCRAHLAELLPKVDSLEF